MIHAQSRKNQRTREIKWQFPLQAAVHHNAPPLFLGTRDRRWRCAGLGGTATTTPRSIKKTEQTRDDDAWSGQSTKSRIHLTLALAFRFCLLALSNVSPREGGGKGGRDAAGKAEEKRQGRGKSRRHFPTACSRVS